MKAKTNVLLIVVALLAYWAGLCNASAFYDPGTQRWLNRDPIEQLGGINLYTFALNTPPTLMDYLGLQKFGNPVLPPNYQYPMFGPLSIPPTTPPGTPTVPPGMPPVTPPSSPGLPGSTTACGAAGGLQIAGSLFNAGSECRARNQALSACEKTAHSVSGSCSCCVATLNRIQNGPGTYYYTGGFGYVANKPCSQVASGSGLSQAGSVTEYNPW